MATLSMLGPYDFNALEIDRVVTKTSLGNYALGYINEKEKTFYPRYVGRSDSDVNKELKAKLPLKHPKFKYSYATSAKAAFEKECQNYHDFGGRRKLENKVHPNRPSGTDWKCPRYI
jgi:hypothetical protein